MLKILKVRKYHAQAFARLGSSAVDRAKLAWLGWHKIDASNISATQNRREMSVTLNNYTITLCPDDDCHVGIFEEMFVYQGYDLDLTSFDPDIILDVGSHIGLFSVAAASRWPDSFILAFEPHPSNAAWARRNFDGNKIRGCVVEAAVGINAGIVNFDARSGMGYVGDCEDSIKVKAVDLRKLIQSFSSFSLLLKMDIEGGEKDLLPFVLPILPPQSAVYVELHGTLDECEQMQDVIKDCDFNIQAQKHRCTEAGDQHFIDLFLRHD